MQMRKVPKENQNIFFFDIYKSKCPVVVCNLGFDLSIGLDKFTIKCVKRRDDYVFACRWMMVMIPMMMMVMINIL